MGTKKRITIYQDLNGPHQTQVRDYVRMTPEERWQEYIKLRRLYLEMVGDIPKPTYRIEISRPSWM